MCFPRYEKTVLYNCYCSLKNPLIKPRVLRSYTRSELDVLLSPSQKYAYHYYKTLFGKYKVIKEIYCNNCLSNERTKIKF